MKRLERLALLLIILLMATHFLSWFGGSLIARLYGPEYVGIQAAHLKLTTSARSLLSILVNLAVGIWLFMQARQSQSTPWIWLLFGMVYGLIAAVLFFLLRIYESKSWKNATAQAPDNTV